MPSPSSSSAQAARLALAGQLKELREQAGLSGRALAERAGWRPQKVSRIEHAVRPISAEDLGTWCRLCGAGQARTEELLAERSAAASMWTSMKRLHRAGFRQAQASVEEVFEHGRRFRGYQPAVIPGLLQTPGYTTAGLISVAELLSLSRSDIPVAVAERQERQRVLRRAGRRFHYVIEEQVLHYRVCEPDVHAEQLRHLLEVMRLPSVSLGVIPLTACRPLRWPCEGFTMIEGEGWATVAVELVSGFLQVTAPGELALYAAEFDALADIAAHGRHAVGEPGDHGDEQDDGQVLEQEDAQDQSAEGLEQLLPGLEEPDHHEGGAGGGGHHACLIPAGRTVAGGIRATALRRSRGTAACHGRLDFRLECGGGPFLSRAAASGRCRLTCVVDVYVGSRAGV
jgi:transcriptional regulator with XRE-family HTH domain